jgi:hypothetical protein
MDWEGSGHDLFEVLPQNLPEGIKEKHEKPIGMLVSQLLFKLSTSRVQV